MDGECAEIWPLPAWEKREKSLVAFSTLDEAVDTYLNVTSYYGQQIEIDNQARLLLPQILRGSAKLDSEVTVFGKLDHLEVRNRENFERSDPGKLMTLEKKQALAGVLKQQSES
jgi:MraZ protein